MAETEFEDVVLYHGSLNELNSKKRRSFIRYGFVEEDFFITDFQKLGFFEKKPFEEIKKQVYDAGYDGLVNARSIIGIGDIEGPHMRHFGMEGTPIVKKK